jgi:hypothetical protein
VLYPASLALRLTAAGSETSNRTSEFVFAGLAATFSLALLGFAGKRLDRRGWQRYATRSLVTAYVGIVFAGGLTVGNPPYDMLPAGYEVGADNRSIDTEGVSAAQWAARHLRGRSHFLADEADSELLTAYSQLRPQSGKVHGVGIGQVLVSPTFGRVERGIISTDKLRYLVVDRRDSTALPRSGHYFDGGDPEKYSAPIAAQALSKFDREPCINRIFSSGNVAIYATERVVSGCR